MKLRSAPIMTVMAVLLAAVPAAAGVDDYLGQTQFEAQQATARGWNGFDDVRVTTGQYHDLSRAIEDGFMPFALDGGDVPTCFDGAGGGMGVHYVRGVDLSVDATRPEAMVYELTPDGGPRLVAVEYVVPAEFVEDAQGNVASLPEVHGQRLHKHASLPLYVLHAWIWEENPAGVFADLNPNVSACPTV